MRRESKQRKDIVVDVKATEKRNTFLSIDSSIWNSSREFAIVLLIVDNHTVE